jgi:hypothetical protein
LAILVVAMIVRRMDSITTTGVEIEAEGVVVEEVDGEVEIRGNRGRTSRRIER